MCYAFSWSYKTDNDTLVKHNVKSSTTALFGWSSVGNTNPCSTDDPIDNPIDNSIDTTCLDSINNCKVCIN